MELICSILNRYCLDIGVFLAQLAQQVTWVDPGTIRFLRYGNRDGLLSGAEAVLLHIRFVFAIDTDLNPVIHRHLSLDTFFIHYYLLRAYLERYLPGTGFRLARRGLLRAEVPECILPEEILQ